MSFKEECYKIGMKNGWCSGRYERADGNPIDPNDCLNKNSFREIDNRNDLIEFFKHGNWCLGQAVIYNNLCFIQQVNGGDEWLTIKDFEDGGVTAFESISFELIIEKDGTNGFDKMMDTLEKVRSKKEYYSKDSQERSSAAIKIESVYKIIKKLNEEEYTSLDTIIKNAAIAGINEQEVNDFIKELKKCGDIYSPKHNQFKISEVKV